MLLLLACSGGFTLVGESGEGSIGSTGAGECVADETKAVLSEHAAAFQEIATTIDRPPDPARVAMFFEAPGRSGGPWFFLDLAAACPASEPAPLCVGAVCYAPRCEGEAWVNEATPESETAGDWTHAQTLQSVVWLGDGSGYGVTLETQASRTDGYTIQGTSRIDVGASLSWTASYQASLAYTQDLTLRFEEDTGWIEIYGFPAASWDGESFVDEDCFSLDE